MPNTAQIDIYLNNPPQSVGIFTIPRTIALKRLNKLAKKKTVAHILGGDGSEDHLFIT